MVCKYLSLTKQIIRGGTEVGGTITPQMIQDIPICNLGRNPDIYAWAGKCNDTPLTGPCWFWIEENETRIDSEFLSG